MTNPMGTEIIHQLQAVPARRLLHAMSSKSRLFQQRSEPKPVRAALTRGANDSPFSLASALREADAFMDTRANLGLTLSIKEAKILDAEAGGFDWGRGEIYVITSMLDGSGRSTELKTALFEGIHDGDLLPLGSGGMLVGMLENPRWFIDFHSVIMESDNDIRELGAQINRARQESGLAEALTAVGAAAAFDPTLVTKVIAAVDTFLQVLAWILGENGDDHIATVHDFYLKQQGFGAARHPAQGRKRFGEAELAYQIDLSTLD